MTLSMLNTTTSVIISDLLPFPRIVGSYDYSPTCIYMQVLILMTENELTTACLFETETSATLANDLFRYIEFNLKLSSPLPYRVWKHMLLIMDSPSCLSFQLDGILDFTCQCTVTKAVQLINLQKHDLNNVQTQTSKQINRGKICGYYPVK